MASLFTGTVEEYASLAAFPLVGVADTIYIALDTNVLYRWNTGTNAYVELSPNIINSLVFNDANGFDGTIALVGSVATLTITTALTTGSVGFIGASGALLQDNANFFWDDTNNRLGIGTNAPTTAIDVFGSGIIGRLNGTSTNNAFLGFASAGTNKWSIGNVQADHRFRIYNDATTSELVSVLQTGEFGIGIANPTTKVHIDGGATALIANLDANVSVAKSISFRSDNSNRINIEVSGTESGSNAGANFFLRTYTDAGALLNTPLTITRSTGAVTLSGTLNLTEIQASTSGGLTLKSNSGTSVALFGAGGGAGTTLYGGLIGTSAIFSSTITSGDNFLINNTAATKRGYTFTSPASSWGAQTSGLYFSPNNTIDAKTTFTIELWNGIGNIITPLTIADTGNATFLKGVGIGATGGANGLFEVSNLGTGVTVGDFLVDAANKNVYVGRLSSTSNDNTNFIVRNRIGTTLLYVTGNTGNVLIGKANTTIANNSGIDLAPGIAYIHSSSGNGILNLIASQSTQAANIGGVIEFGAVYRSSDAATTTIARIKGLREDATSNFWKSYISFETTNASDGYTLSEKMRLNSSGNLLINTTTDGNGSLIVANANNYGITLRRGNTTDRFYFFVGQGSPYIQDDCYIGSNNADIHIRAGATGGVKLSVGATSWVSDSDIRLKDKIGDIDNALESILKLETLKFNWKYDYELENKRAYFGLVAQNVQELLPELVEIGRDEMKTLGVKYTELIPILVKAIQQQQAQIELLKTK
jgi:hypothetical protein